MVTAYSAAPTVSARCLPESHQTTWGASHSPSTRSRRPADLATAGCHRRRSQPVALLSAQLTCFTGFERLNDFKNYFLGQRLQRRTAGDCYSALAQALPPWRRIFQRLRWGDKAPPNLLALLPIEPAELAAGTARAAAFWHGECGAASAKHQFARGQNTNPAFDPVTAVFDLVRAFPLRGQPRQQQPLRLISPAMSDWCIGRLAGHLARLPSKQAPA